MDHAGRVAVFDSGLGGLAVLRAIRAELPGERLVYLADSAMAPYGDRTPAEIAARTLAIGGHAAAGGAAAIVLACHTASVVAAPALRAAHPAWPVVALEPAIKPALEQSRCGVVGVLATTRTIESAAVARLVARFGAGARIVLQPCPGLVEAVEAGEIDSPRTAALLAPYLKPALDAGADTLVLGCTHYVWLAPLIRRLAGPAVAMIEPSVAVARQLARRLPAPAAGRVGDDDLRFLTTGEPAVMAAALARLGWPQAAVERLPIDDAAGADRQRDGQEPRSGAAPLSRS